jgi:glycine cleavage system H protein
MDFPNDLRYTEQHEWARLEGDRVRVGITDYAQAALGDVVYVDTPDVGTQVTGGEPFGEVESTKSVSDVYAPVSGVVVEVNALLADSPDRVNEDPYGEGWMIVIEPSDPSALEALWDADRYRTFTESRSGQA